MSPLWTIVSDDLTGLQAIAGEFARLGFRVGTGISKLPIRAELESFEIYGFDTATRALKGDEAELHVTEAVGHLLSIGATRLFKHNDSILQGHVGRELRAVATTAGARPIVYVPACPNRRRVTVGGIQFEVDEQDEFVSGGLRQDLSQCVARDTGLTTCLIDRAVLRAGSAAAMIADSQCDVVIVDAMTEEDLDLVVLATEQAGCRVLSGSVGLAAALARAAMPRRRFAQPAVIVAGSLQPATQRQIEQLLTRPDCASIRVTLDAGETAEPIGKTISKMRSALSQGLHCVVWTHREALLCADADNSVYPALSRESLERMRHDLGALLHGVAADADVPFGGLVVAGGSTADLALRDAFGVTRFTGLGWLCEGMTVAIAADGARPGLAVITKSGGWGPPDALSNAIDRLAGWRCTQPSSISSHTGFRIEGISR